MSDLFSLRLLFAILTCYRLAQLLAYENGPFFVIRRVRTLIENQKEREQAGGKLQGPWASLYDFATCPYCQGIWLSLGCLALVLWPTIYGDFFLVWWGIAGAQAYFQARGIV